MLALTPAAPPTVAVIIPVYNGGEAFRRVLNALLQASPAPDEVIVVNDGGTDASADIAAGLGAQVIRRPARGGPAQARNQGARAATTEILLFLDSDVLAPLGVIGRIRALFQSDPSLDALFGSYDDAPAAGDFLSQYKNLLHHFVHQSGREQAFTFWAGCGAVRRDVFLSLGGFDEKYTRPSIEDIEFGYRLNRAGHKVMLCKDLQVKHLKRWQVTSLLRSDIMDRAIPWAQLIVRNGAIPDDLNLKVAGRCSAVTAWALACLLAASVRNIALLFPAAIAAAILWILNAPLYAFFYRKRGFGFMLGAVLCHWLYYLYSSTAFAVAVVQHLLRTGIDRALRLRKAASLGRS
ncbi:MAG TPA: glycosyltransferase family A protein [Candidatus Binatia bacterium]